MCWRGVDTAADAHIGMSKNVCHGLCSRIQVPVMVSLMLLSSVAWVMCIRWKSRDLKPVLPAVLATCCLSPLEMLIWVQIILCHPFHTKSLSMNTRSSTETPFLSLLCYYCEMVLCPNSDQPPLNTVKCSLIPHNAPLTRHGTHRRPPSIVLGFAPQPFRLNCFQILKRMQIESLFNNQ